MIISEAVIDFIYTETEAIVDEVTLHKGDLIEEVKMFEMSVNQLKGHPWINLTNTRAKRDTSGSLYKKIQENYVGDDPEEDYKEVIVWKIANMLYITASVDHDPKISLKWDVVVFNEEA